MFFAKWRARRRIATSKQHQAYAEWLLITAGQNSPEIRTLALQVIDAEKAVQKAEAEYYGL